MAPLEIPSYSGESLSRPIRSLPAVPRVPQHTMRFGSGDFPISTSDNSPPSPFPTPNFNNYSQRAPVPDASSPTHYPALPTSPINTTQLGRDELSRMTRYSSFHRNTISNGSFSSRWLHLYLVVSSLLCHLLRYFIKLPVDLYLFINQIRLTVPRFYWDRFNYHKYIQHSAAERGDIDHVERLWAEQAQMIISDYVILATGSSGSFSVVVTVMQLQATTSNAYVTTLIVSSIVFILHGICCSVMFLAYKRNLSSPAVAAAWSQASDPSSTFWNLLALPLHFVLCASALTCAAMFLLAWNNSGGDASSTDPPITPLPTSGGLGSAPSPPQITGPDLADRVSIPLRRAFVTIFIVYGIWRIANARKKLAAMVEAGGAPTATNASREAGSSFGVGDSN